MVDAGDPAATARPRVPPEVAAEAAVWVARLHGPGRSPQMDRECLAWQARSALHREAFERCTETWLAVPGVTVASAFASMDARADWQAQARAEDWSAAAGVSSRRPLRWAAALGLVAVVAGGAVLLQPWRSQGDYRTGVGEQQVVLLDDGTRMTLNTDTRVAVALARSQRVVEVQSGEAVFEVARDPQRAFIVRAGGSEVEALGTTFAVRYIASATPQAAPGLAVTLIEGQVAVRPAPAGSDAAAAAQPVLMHAGERVLLAAAGAAQPVPPRVDRPDIARLLAWQRSEAVFDDATLADAVAEMNRYSRTPIVLLDAPTLGGLRVSGLYRTGDSAGFARAVATLHGLALQESPGRLALAKAQ